MAIRRIGDDSTEKRVLKALGKVLVTIDDLHALHALMTDLERFPGNDSLLKIGFQGGEFDSPDELVELSDNELESIWLRTPNLEVELSSQLAVAIGRKDVTEAVYQRWARQRQTREVPGDLRKRRRNFWIPVLTTSLLTVVAFVLMLIASNQMLWAYIEVGTGVATLAIVAMGILSSSMSIDSTSHDSYAVIRAITLNEYRTSRTESQKHWRTIAMSAIATTIALVGIVLGLLFKK